KDADTEVRAQAARVLGWRRVAPALREGGSRPTEGELTAIHRAWARAAAALAPLLEDDNPRVRFFAALALRHTGSPQTRTAVLKMLRDNGEQDPYLRHAGVMAMTGCFDRDALRATAKDESPSVRLAALLALRRRQSPEVAQFLNDAEPRLVLEAAR